MDLSTPPDRYWHCLVELEGQKYPAIVNDLSFLDLQKLVVDPWRAGRPFTVSGTIVRTADSVSRVRIVHTVEPQSYFAERHEARMAASGVADMATNRRALPFSGGQDLTFELLFDGPAKETPSAEQDLVERLCRRIPQVARLLAARGRGKPAFTVADEYDVQDLLHATLRGYLKYSVQEDPLPKVAGAKSSRADISIEELGVIIEVKFARGPSDQKRLFEELSQDLTLYAEWVHLRTLICLVYNAGDLRDPEALEKLGGRKSISGRDFDVVMVLA